MENIKFSIIMPAYNAESAIINSINSVLNQTYHNYEFIIIDDCSTDNTYNVVKEYPQIRLFQTPVNSKQGAARNIGLNNATGDYVFFLDADDTFYDNQVLENLAKTINKNDNPDIVYMGMKLVGKNNLEIIPTEDNTDKAFRLGKNKWMNVTSLCTKLSLIQNNNFRFPEHMRYEDVVLAFLIIDKAQTYTYVDYFTYLYITRENSTTTTYSFAQAIDTARLIEELAKLKNVINKENIPYLKERIAEQKEKLNTRMERAIESYFQDK